MANAVKTFVGTLDADVVMVEGRDRVDLLHRLSTQDLRPLASPGRALATLFVTDKGKLVDWVLVVSVPERLLVRTSPGRGERFAAWIERYTIMEDVRCTVARDLWTSVLVQGAAAASCVGLEHLPSLGEGVAQEGVWWLRGHLALGARLEAFVPRDQEPQLIERLTGCGVLRADAALIERWRIEAGVPSPLHEFRDEVNPLELRLGRHAVSWTKGCFVGQEVLNRIDSQDKLARELAGIEVGAGIVVREGDAIVYGDERVGEVTSLASRDDGTTVGLAILRRKALGVAALSILTAEGPRPLVLRDCPFWSEGTGG
ncbi:MAG: hypothetical protein AAB426_08145 [Myxococcota bacterium]